MTEFGEWRYYACPRCGGMHTRADGYALSHKCEVCDINFIDIDMPCSKVYDMPDEARAAWRKEVEVRVRANPLFSEEAFQARVARKEREKAFQKIKQTPSITCPHCGHDKFQMVARKWSLLTGFLTNKVDRVCERCKRRF